MNCQYCKKEFIPNLYARNIKFCSATCRNKTYQPRMTEWQRQKRNSRASESANKMECMICNRWYRQVGTHIRMFHKMKARDYRKEYGFDVKKGQTVGELKERRKQIVFENGHDENLKAGKVYRFKKGGPIPRYERSEQTLERLKGLYKLRKNIN